MTNYNLKRRVREPITFKHRIRSFLGIHGLMQNGKYCFDVPKYPTNFKAQRIMYIFMYYLGNPFLNLFLSTDLKNDKR